MKRFEVLGVCIWFLLGVGICTGAISLTLGSFSNPGPGLFPFMSGSALVLLSLILGVQVFRKKITSDQATGVFENYAGAVRAGLVCIALLGYAISMEYLGFAISTALFLAFLLGPIGTQRWHVVIGFSIVATAAMYAVFKIWLNLPLPSGLLGM